jgi:hypothetical protein
MVGLLVGASYPGVAAFHGAFGSMIVDEDFRADAICAGLRRKNCRIEIFASLSQPLS